MYFISGFCFQILLEIQRICRRFRRVPKSVDLVMRSDVYYVYCQTLKTQHLVYSFNLYLEKEGRTLILIVS